MMARRQSAAVYRRRRQVVFGGALLLVVVIVIGAWLLIARPWQSSPQAGAEESPSAEPVSTPSSTDESADETPSTEPSASSSPDPTEDETSGVQACTAEDVTVTAVTDAETYAAGVLPQLSLSLTNNGTADCTIDVGTATQQFTISSGSDTWWRSTDCQSDSSSQIVTLTAGQTVTSATPLTWDRTRSSVSTCGDTSRPSAPGDGASYHLSVSIGGIASAESRQIFLY